MKIDIKSVAKPAFTAIEVIPGDVFRNSSGRFFMVMTDPNVGEVPGAQVFTVDLWTGEWRRFSRDDPVTAVRHVKVTGDVE